MKVRTGRIPGVPNSSNDLPSNNVIIHFYSNAVGLKMRVEGKLMLSSVPWNTTGGAGKSTGTPKRSGFFERLAGAYCALAKAAQQRTMTQRSEARGAAESVNAGRPGGSNLGNAALASLSIGDYTSQGTPSGRLDGMQSRQR